MQPTWGFAVLIEGVRVGQVFSWVGGRAGREGNEVWWDTEVVPNYLEIVLGSKSLFGKQLKWRGYFLDNF